MVVLLEDMRSKFSSLQPRADHKEECTTIKRLLKKLLNK